MNKIIEVALSNKFGKDVEALMEVIGATPNPEMATEILLGVYTEPTIPSKVIHSSSKVVRTLVPNSVNHWLNQLSYTYIEEICKHIYVKKDLDTSVITPENYERYAERYGEDDVISFTVRTGEFKERTSSCNISDWCLLEEYVEEEL